MKENKKLLVEAMLASMIRTVKTKGLDLMETYPNDLLVHAKNYLIEYAVPGAQFGWCVGHVHSHLLILGIDKDLNELAAGITNLGTADRFYLIKINSWDSFDFIEKDKRSFADMANTPIRYKKVGQNDDFYLMIGEKRIGHVHVDLTGAFEESLYKVTCTPATGISEIDRNALLLAARRAHMFVDGNLFIKAVVEVAEPEAEEMAA